MVLLIVQAPLINSVEVLKYCLGAFFETFVMNGFLLLSNV